MDTVALSEYLGRLNELARVMRDRERTSKRPVDQQIAGAKAEAYEGARELAERLFL